jgi:hypothetical protein
MRGFVRRADDRRAIIVIISSIAIPPHGARLTANEVQPLRR